MMKRENQGTSGGLGRPRDLAAAKRRKQFALIAILLVVLVLAITSSKSTEKQVNTNGSVPAATLVSLKQRKPGLPTDRDDGVMQRFNASGDLPSMSFDQILSTNLFAGPQIVVTAPVTAPYPAQPSVPTSNMNLKVGAVYGSFDGPDRAALIGGRIVQSGEEITPGVTVLSISAEGVEVAP